MVVGLTGIVAMASSSAVCVGPEVEVTPTSGTPGAAITVEGHYYGTDCIDTGPNPSLGAPDTGVVVSFVDATGTVTELGTVDADADYRFTLPATVPSGAAVGMGSIQAPSSTGFAVQPAGFTVVDGVIPATPVFTG